MAKFEPAVLTSWRGWPSMVEGPYVIVFRWALTPDATRVECVGVEIRTYADDELAGVEHYHGPRAEDASRRAITAQLWRSIRVRELIDLERTSLAELMPESWDVALWRRPAPRGLHLRRGDHEAVAAAYREALASGEPPRKAVAETFHLSLSAAAKRIARAREHGLLPTTTRGRTHTSEER